MPYLIAGYSEDCPQIETGTYIAALYELNDAGFFLKTYTPAEKKVLTEVSGVKWTMVGNAGSVLSYSPVCNQIQALFDPITWDSTVSSFLFANVGPNRVR